MYIHPSLLNNDNYSKVKMLHVLAVICLTSQLLLISECKTKLRTLIKLLLCLSYIYHWKSKCVPCENTSAFGWSTFMDLWIFSKHIKIPSICLKRVRPCETRVLLTIINNQIKCEQSHEPMRTQIKYMHSLHATGIIHRKMQGTRHSWL